MFDLASIAVIRPGVETRSISAENPTGQPGMGARARVGDDPHTTQAAREFPDRGLGWKVRPCLRLRPGDSATLCDIEGPGVVRHIWITLDSTRSRLFTLRVYYDGSEQPSIEMPVCDFFANGVNGQARIASLPIAVNPTGGMNSYWPMPFHGRLKITISNDWPTPHPTPHPSLVGPAGVTARDRATWPVEEFFYQITWSREPVPESAGMLHAQWRRTVTDRARPEFTIVDGVRGPGQFVGTYLIWQQLANGWWGEGEVKFFIDGDGGAGKGAPSAVSHQPSGIGHQASGIGQTEPGTRNSPPFPTICGTGTEDYFGGAWGFAEPDEHGIQRPIPYTTAFLGYPQAIIDKHTIPVHGLYRWHVPDPIRFQSSLRVTCQALGWWPTRTYQPLADDIIAVGLFYARDAQAVPSPLPGVYERLLR